MKVKVFKKNQEMLDISSEIFGAIPNQKLLVQAIQSQWANRRRPIAHTKNRGEVSGGGRKPFRQKGTGRARAGSVRSPIWIGGGIVFGPRRTRNFQKRLPQKMQKKALFMALSWKLKEKKLIIVPEIKFPKISTNLVQSFLETLPIKEGKILVILGKTEANFELSAANLPFLKVIQAQNINLLDLLKFDYILTDKEGIKSIEKNLRTKNE